MIIFIKKKYYEDLKKSIINYKNRLDISFEGI
jgi:hypothetical protein